MSDVLSDLIDEETSFERSSGSCDQCDTSTSSVVSYDARYIYRLQQASNHLASTESHFYHNKVPLLDKLEKRCVSLSMDLIAANETLFSYRFDDQIAMDNLMWTLRFAPFGGSRTQYMMELRVQSEWVEEVNWHAEVRLKVTLGGKMLSPLRKFNHPVRFSSQSPSLLVFVVDAATVRAWPSGLVQVDIYPEDLVGVNIAPLFSSKSDPSDVTIRVHNGKAHRTFYVNRRWIESQSEYFDEKLNGSRKTTLVVFQQRPTQEIDVNAVAPRDFLLLLRGMERFEEQEMFHPKKIESFLRMIDMFKAGPLSRTVGHALEDTHLLDIRTKMELADKYLPWYIIERILDLCDAFDLRCSKMFDTISLRLREEVIRRTSHHFPSTMPSLPRGGGGGGGGTDVARDVQ
ncbi:hypothetical protein PRIPAC_83591 [Pristionchus pacificus]|uniref:BTB domain-containing protein n=1 Tax=Pristionchus pacificus TaxID=54126 RepID=A0A2A6BKB3_PRIPA|nr:hypothetical protein PRIPAC_83591 [Pristionchus pacificus]|eukprot:PDM66352.1 BTB domain-containing protein [Pristionchus pacificus]